MIETANARQLDGYLSPAQAARRMGISVTHVRWLCNTGRLRHVRTALGRHIATVDADAWQPTRIRLPRKRRKS